VRLLALDSATELCSAALILDDRELTREEMVGRGHAERLLPMVDELLSEAGIAVGSLDGFAVGRGPGAFTGVRIAISIVQGLAQGTGLPVVPVSNLAAIAARAIAPPGLPVLSLIDARMGQLYWAVYGPDCFASGQTSATWQTVREHLSAPESVEIPASRVAVAGPGWGVYPALSRRLESSVETANASLWPRALDIARLARAGLAAGQGLPAEAVEPVYLRNSVTSPSSRAPAGPRRQGA
jgi:tRNA threonylcarbamoyladenosine biosynthesis protein TsaB